MTTRYKRQTFRTPLRLHVRRLARACFLLLILGLIPLFLWLQTQDPAAYRFLLFRVVDRAHATLPDQLEKPVPAHPVAHGDPGGVRRGGGGPREGRGFGSARGSGEEPTRPVIGSEQVVDPAAEGAVVAAGAAEEGLAVGRIGEGAGGGEDGLLDGIRWIHG